MKHKKTIFLVILTAGCAWLAFLTPFSPLHPRDFPRAYPFVLKDMQDNRLSYRELQGKKGMLISFWAVYCLPCVQEMRELRGVIRNYPEIKFYFINIDEGPEDTRKKKIRAFLRRYRLNDLRVLLDSGQFTADVYLRRFKTKKTPGNNPIPALFIIDRRNRIRHGAAGGKKIQMKKIRRILRRISRGG